MARSGLVNVKKHLVFVGVWLLSLTVLGAGVASAAPPLETVDRVDLERYQGRWYEIARLPNFFQRKCAGEVTAEYAPIGDGTVSVHNRCVTADGGVAEVTGLARPADRSGTNARLEVSFLPKWLRWVPFTWGDYWVIALGEDYDHVLVGTPDRGYLWVLARTPSLADAIYQRLMERAAAAGFDVKAVVRTASVVPPGMTRQ